MNDLRTEHANRETDNWTQFEQATLAIPRDRWEEPGVLPEWSVKDMLWHVAGWIDECSQHLEKMREGTFTEPEETDDDTDVRNAGFAEAAASMDVNAVWEGLVAARELVRRRWDELPEVTDTAIEWFAGETYQHYKEHLPDLEKFASG
jgi:Mycothiol maleylpyruvate isomerase N-terminal domain